MAFASKDFQFHWLRRVFQWQKAALLLGFCCVMVLGSCSKYKYTTTTHQMLFTEIDTLDILVHQRSKKIRGVVLLIPDYDSLYSETHKHLVGPLVRKKMRVVEVPKFAYDDWLVRGGTDDMDLYLSTINYGFNYYKEQYPEDSILPLNIVGINEGAIVAPRVATILQPEVLVLANPHWQPFRLLMLELTANDTTAPFKNLCKDLHITSADEALAWMHYIDISDPIDRFLGGRSVRYWKSYFDYNPVAYFEGYTRPIFALSFDDFHLHTNSEGLYQAKFFKGKPFESKRIGGTGKDRKGYQDIEKWLYRDVKFQRL